MLKRYGNKALEESAARADELMEVEHHNGVAVWRHGATSLKHTLRSRSMRQGQLLSIKSFHPTGGEKTFNETYHVNYS
jgi:hypothetical protein